MVVSEPMCTTSDLLMAMQTSASNVGSKRAELWIFDGLSVH